MIKTKYPLQRLDWLADLSSGTTPSRAKHEAYFRNGNMPWVKTGDLNNGPILSTDEQITQKAIDECGVKIYPTGTVLVAMYGGFRQIGRTGRLEMPAGINQALCALQISADRGCPQFVQVALNHFVGQWRRFAASSRKDPNITGRDVATFKLPTPRLEMQKAIGSIAGEFGKQLRDGDFLIRQLIRRKTDLMRELLSGRRRFPEFVESEAHLRDGWLEHPADWPPEPVGNFASETNEKPAVEEVPVLSSTKYDGLVDSLKYFGRRVYSDDTSNYKLVRRGQFAYATNHIEEGSIGLLQHREAGLVSPMYTVFEINGDALPSFLFPLFKSDRYVHRFGAMTNGSVNRRGGLRWTDFSLLKVALPSVAEQSKIVELVELLNAEIRLLKRQRAAIEKQKRGVMERLLSGDVIIPADVVEQLNLDAEKGEQQGAKDAKDANLAEATTENAS